MAVRPELSIPAGPGRLQESYEGAIRYPGLLRLEADLDCPRRHHGTRCNTCLRSLTFPWSAVETLFWAGAQINTRVTNSNQQVELARAAATHYTSDAWPPVTASGSCR
jgi:hypothetical protein